MLCCPVLNLFYLPLIHNGDHSGPALSAAPCGALVKGCVLGLRPLSVFIPGQ